LLAAATAEADKKSSVYETDSDSKAKPRYDVGEISDAGAIG
jgi:hypothetical protein